VSVELTFTFKRPKSHVTSKGTLREGYSEYHVQRPDVDKLSRAILDALTGIAYQDDSQVVTLAATKTWGDSDGVEISTFIL
jgi:crossover junction endodeoxyribonuclease RusA